MSRADSEPIRRALDYLRKFDPGQLDNVYSVSLQTMVFAAAKPREDIVRIQSNVDWLQEAQIVAGDHAPWPGSWTYKISKVERGDNSNAQYALLALNAASEVGVRVRPEVWKLARDYWQKYQLPDGSWAYTPEGNNGSTASMTCAGISSLVITGLKRFRGLEKLVGEHGVEDCGRGGSDPSLQPGSTGWRPTSWSARTSAPGSSGSITTSTAWSGPVASAGSASSASHDWYREGAEELVHDQDKLDGFWRGVQYERIPTISTSFALLFLAKGRAPVLVNKLRHGPGNDWNNDVDDVRNLVGVVSRDWEHLLTWQVVDPNLARVEDMLQAKIAFFNGHEAPIFDAKGKQVLREFVEQGGFIFADACCGRPSSTAGSAP